MVKSQDRYPHSVYIVVYPWAHGICNALRSRLETESFLSKWGAFPFILRMMTLRNSHTTPKVRVLVYACYSKMWLCVVAVRDAD
jgi:hypothetical protein